jgi:hypothetical protein
MTDFFLLSHSRSGYSVHTRPELFRRSAASKTARTLTELCSEPAIFEQLHGYFAWILRNCTTRLFERQLEGPSLIGQTVALPPELSSALRIFRDFDE